MDWAEIETGDCGAGNFFSAAFESGCATVQGASGGVFGMIGLFIADLVLNFETVRRSASPSSHAALLQ